LTTWTRFFSGEGGRHDRLAFLGGENFGGGGRAASLRCKEWTDGLAREVALIKSDCGALGWAMGSAR
jgi:hypothetical protein